MWTGKYSVQQGFKVKGHRRSLVAEQACPWDTLISVPFCQSVQSPSQTAFACVCESFCAHVKPRTPYCKDASLKRDAPGFHFGITGLHFLNGFSNTHSTSCLVVAPDSN